MTLINVTSLLRRARENALAAGVDLSAPLLPALDDPEFEEARRQTRASREALVERVAGRQA